MMDDKALQAFNIDMYRHKKAEAERSEAYLVQAKCYWL